MENNTLEFAVYSIACVLRVKATDAKGSAARITIVDDVRVSDVYRSRREIDRGGRREIGESELSIK